MSSQLPLQESSLPIPDLQLGVNSRTGKRVVVLTSLDSRDPTRPDKWSWTSKLIVLATGILTDFNSTLASSLPSNTMRSMAREFDINSPVQLTLPISLYVVGFVVGPILWGPLSETYGRKPLLLLPMLGYAAFSVGCALAPTWGGLLAFRCLCGLMASSPIAVVGGLFADVFTDEDERGVYLMYFIAVSAFGPCLGPIVSGIVTLHASWRWVYCVALILALITLPLIEAMPETYQPVLLQKRASALRQALITDKIVTNSIADVHDPIREVPAILTRPFRLLFTEAVTFLSCIYLALIYGVFYLTFEAWPIAYQGVYGMSPLVSSLAYLPFGAGNLLAVVLFFQYDNFIKRAQSRGQSWSFRSEYRRLPLACLGGPLWTISLFWLGWSVDSFVHWTVPMLSGLTLGAGFLLIFIAILNHLSDAYTIYSASVQSASSISRSIFGAVLPIATSPMIERLGFAWSCSLLGFFSCAMIPIPFAFIYWAEQLNDRSQFLTQLDELRANGGETATTHLSHPVSIGTSTNMVIHGEGLSRPKPRSTRSLRIMCAELA